MATRTETDDDAHVAHLKQLVVDCRHPAALARFWAAALDDFEIRAYDEAEVARLASSGRTPDTDPCVVLDGPTVEICFQEVDVADVAKNPLHIDIAATNQAEEATRLVALGATIVARFDHHTWLRDPEGNDFCVTDA